MCNGNGAVLGALCWERCAQIHRPVPPSLCLARWSNLPRGSSRSPALTSSLKSSSVCPPNVCGFPQGKREEGFKLCWTLLAAVAWTGRGRGNEAEAGGGLGPGSKRNVICLKRTTVERNSSSSGVLWGAVSVPGDFQGI